MDNLTWTQLLFIVFIWLLVLAAAGFFDYQSYKSTVEIERLKEENIRFKKLAARLHPWYECGIDECFCHKEGAPSE